MTHPNEKKNSDVIFDILAKVSRKTIGSNNWGLRHAAAWDRPKGGETHERTIVELVTALGQIGDTVKEGGRGVKDDYVLRPIFMGLARNCVALLNFDCGRLDCGTVDRTVRAIAENEGLSGDLED